MKFLVLGVSGMAGHIIALYLKEQDHDVTGFSRREVNFVKSIAGDATNTELLKKIITDGQFDVVINAIGVLNKACDEHTSTAIFLNGVLPHFLAETCSNLETRIIHMSTDCVYAGNTGPYTEMSFPDGRSYYDRSKAIGELRDEKNLTLRNSIVGPDINENGIGLFNWFMKQPVDKPINGFTKAMWTGLTTFELAKIMLLVSEQWAKGSSTPNGLINMVYKSNISKFNLLKLFNHYLRNDAVTINPSEQLVLDKTLVRGSDSFDYEVPSYDTMVKEMADWIVSHKEIYSHYF